MLSRILIVAATLLFITGCQTSAPRGPSQGPKNFSNRSNYLIVPLDLVNFKGQPGFCEIDKDTNIASCDPKHFQFGALSQRLIQSSIGPLFFASKRSNRSGRFAFAGTLHKEPGREIITSMGKSTFVADFKPGTVVIIANVKKSREQALINTVRATLLQKFGRQVQFMKYTVAQPYSLDCDSDEGLGAFNPRSAKCKVTRK
ncbi:hypothetical protein [Flexibacterium corallicola]|uniref:hypothetical protein n=1 Tax=Flexibacterium corallicola TaxID=3037259 RepID=UPI00286F79DA|nr:hypothetical protein [Pseudovibrio sp. M1P-2-3]